MLSRPLLSDVKSDNVLARGPVPSRPAAAWEFVLADFGHAKRLRAADRAAPSGHCPVQSRAQVPSSMAPPGPVVLGEALRRARLPSASAGGATSRMCVTPRAARSDSLAAAPIPPKNSPVSTLRGTLASGVTAAGAAETARTRRVASAKRWVKGARWRRVTFAVRHEHDVHTAAYLSLSYTRVAPLLWGSIPL